MATGSRAAASPPATTIDAASATRIGRSRPCRSVTRPTIGLSPASSKPAATKTDAIARADQPPASSASGPRTTSIPKRKAGSVFSQRPPRNRGSRNALARPEVEIGSAGVARGTVAIPANTNATTATAANDGRVPTRSATPPNKGPSTAPKTAAPKAVPMTSPRRSRGAVTASHASAPAHVIVLDSPWIRRAATRASALSAPAKAALATPRRTNPATTARFAPSFAAATPPSIPPTIAPAPNAPTRTPAPVLERSNSSA